MGLESVHIIINISVKMTVLEKTLKLIRIVLSFNDGIFLFIEMHMWEKKKKKKSFLYTPEGKIEIVITS